MIYYKVFYPTTVVLQSRVIDYKTMSIMFEFS